MHQDRQGFMWFGTTDGLYRYDGYNLKAFRHSPFDSTSLSSNRIRGLYEDPEGLLWVGTMNGGINRFDPGTDSFTRFRHVPGDANSLSSDIEIRAIGEDRYGRLWVGTGRGLNRLNRESGTFTRFRHNVGDAASRIRVFFLDRSGSFWIGTAGGLLRLNPDGETFTRYVHDSRHGRTGPALGYAVTSIVEDSTSLGILWLGTDRGLLRFDPTTGQFRRLVPDPTDEEIPAIQDLIPDPQVPGVLWAATAGEGLVRFNTRTERFSKVRRDRDASAFGSDSPLSLYADRFGSLWVSSLNAVDQFITAPGDSVYYHYVPGDPTDLEAPMVSSIYEDSAGALWVGLFQGEISKVGGVDFSGGSLRRIDRASGRSESWKHIPDDPNSMGDGIVASILEDHAGRLWVGIWGGGLNLMDRETGRFTQFTHDPDDTTSLSGDRVVTLFEDRDGTLWIGTNKRGGLDAGGLNRMDAASGRFTRFVPSKEDPTSLSGVTVLAITQDVDGRLWIGTNDGLNHMDRARGTFTSYRHDPDDRNSLLDNYVQALYSDTTGLLWIGTPSGMDRFDPRSGTFTHFTEREGLIGGAVMGIVPDEEGNLWISTRNGLSKLDSQTGTIRNYEGESNLASTQYLLGAHFRSAGGELFFPSPNGVLAFFPRRLLTNSVPPSVVVTDVRPSHASSMPISIASLTGPAGITEAIQLAHDQNSIEFEYVALHFINPAKNQYAYRLKGFDAGWVQAGTQRTARYTNLNAGRYVFQVKAANSDGVWNEEGASVPIVIASPWWRTTWAYVFYGVLLLGGVLAVARVQRRRIHRRARADAQIREAEIRAEALESEIRHKELALEKARELERANARLKAHEEQLETQALRLQALDEMKSRFFANISHEFRTPLTLILGPIDDLLRDGGTLDHRTLDGMRRSARRLLRLVDELLALARLEFGSMTLQARRIDVVASVRSMVLAFAARAEQEEITLSFLSSTERIDGTLDVHKLETIITNLLSNAFQYTPRGGKIGVSVGVEAEDDGLYAHVIVRDTGEGIPPGELPYVFDRFYQGDRGSGRRRGGLGLGLALSKELVELHGGVLRVESQVGFGTTFIVRLPTGGEHHQTDDVIEDIAEEPGAVRLGVSDSTSAKTATAEEAAPADEKIPAEEVVSADEADPAVDPTEQDLVLVVEDNPDLRAHLRRHLAGPYNVIEAPDGVEGLALVRQHRPALVIADVMMPNMDGLALCRAIKEDPALGHTPVVILTARAAEEDLIEGLETGADDYLTKPFSSEELMARLENLIEVRRRLRERLSDEVVIRPGPAVVSSEQAAFLERVRQVIEKRMSEGDFGVGQLAAELNMSTRQLQRKMKEGAPLSASACIRMMRLERAAQLLEQDAGRVSEIAAAVGYSDAKHFSGLFRQVFGVPPSEFGRRTRQEG